MIQAKLLLECAELGCSVALRGNVTLEFRMFHQVPFHPGSQADERSCNPGRSDTSRVLGPLCRKIVLKLATYPLTISKGVNIIY